MHLGCDQPPRSRSYMVRRIFVQSDRQELPHTERIGQTPCNAPLAVDAFKGPDHHAPEDIPGASDGRPSSA
jgi:hypothetical protein